MKGNRTFTPWSVPIRSPRSRSSFAFSLRGLTLGQMDTMSLIPISASSRVMASGSGHFLGSNFQSPCRVQWKKSDTITERGRPRLLYSLATSRSSSWLPYRNLHCQKPAAHSGSMGLCPVTSA